MNQLEDATFRHLYAWGFNTRAREIRRVVEVDYLDEQLIREGFLEGYKALVFAWGNVIEAEVLDKIDAWMRDGGAVFYPSFPKGPLGSVEGDTVMFSRWTRGDTGAGMFQRFPGDMEPPSRYAAFVREELRQMNTLHPLTRKALAIERPEHVFFSVGDTGDLMALNYDDKSVSLRTDKDKTVVLPSYGMVRCPPGEW
jgi:hypothetical protein